MDLEKPADLDLQFSLEFISGFILFYRVTCIIFLGISKISAKLSSLCSIRSLGQVKFSLDKYIKAIYYIQSNEIQENID